MAFDSNKPYGTIFGHTVASYEQDGILYDAVGNPFAGEDINKEFVVDVDIPVVALLNTLLSGGPVIQDNIYKETQIAEMDWAEVQSAASDMGVKRYKYQGKDMWKLV